MYESKEPPMIDEQGNIIPIFKEEFKKLADMTVVYRSGRLGCFVYIEGNENPINMRKLEATGNPQLNKQIQKVDISQLFNRDIDPMEDFFKKWLPVLLLIGVVVVIIILLSKGQAPDQVAQTPIVQTIPGG